MLALTLAVVLSGWTQVTKDPGFVGFDGKLPFAETQLDVGGSTLRILIASGDLPVGRDAVRAWIEGAAKATAAYYGRFPGKSATITVLTGMGGQVSGGMTFGGRAVRIHVGRDATVASMAADWRLPHELLHLGFVDLDDRYLYLEEGLATYVEPIIRARAGQISVDRVWNDFLDGMPNGASGEPLALTQSWGNTYWGGARFWLLADLEIRAQTSGKKTLQDALRGILEKGGDGKVHLALEEMLALGDAATGTRVLQKLHARLGEKGEAANLDALWKQLGVSKQNGKVVFDDTAPLAATRAALTSTAAAAKQAD